MSDAVVSAPANPCERVGTRRRRLAGALSRVRPLTWLAIGFVKAWRAVISPLYGSVCKYEPSCSAYGLRTLQVHGVVRATPMIVWRILRCNPWSHGGYDPVPGTEEAAVWQQRQRERLGGVVEHPVTPDEGTTALPHSHPRASRSGECRRSGAADDTPSNPRGVN